MSCTLCIAQHTKESNLSNFVIEYLGEFETEFENALYPVYQGPRWVRIVLFYHLFFADRVPDIKNLDPDPTINKLMGS